MSKPEEAKKATESKEIDYSKVSPVLKSMAAELIRIKSRAKIHGGARILS